MPNSVSAFKKRSSSTGSVSANTAYYTSDSEASTLPFHINTPTGIESVKTSKAVTFYDLHGREVAHPTKGIYITSDGHKVWVK